MIPILGYCCINIFIKYNEIFYKLLNFLFALIDFIFVILHIKASRSFTSRYFDFYILYVLQKNISERMNFLMNELYFCTVSYLK